MRAYTVATHVGITVSAHDALAATTVTTTVAAGLPVPGGHLGGYLLDKPMRIQDGSTWAYLAYLGVVTGAFAYVLLHAGLRSTSSGLAVVATLLEPVAAALLAFLALGERPGSPVTVGSLLTVRAIASLGRGDPAATGPAQAVARRSRGRGGRGC